MHIYQNAYFAFFHFDFIWQTSVGPAQISIWTNPNKRCDRAPTTMSKSSDSQGDPLLALSVGTGGWSTIVGGNFPFWPRWGQK